MLVRALKLGLVVMQMLFYQMCLKSNHTQKNILIMVFRKLKLLNGETKLYFSFMCRRDRCQGLSSKVTKRAEVRVKKKRSLPRNSLKVTKRLRKRNMSIMKSLGLVRRRGARYVSILTIIFVSRCTQSVSKLYQGFATLWQTSTANVTYDHLKRNCEN